MQCYVNLTRNHADLNHEQHHSDPSQFALAFAGNSDYSIDLKISNYRKKRNVTKSVATNKQIDNK